MVTDKIKQSHQDSHFFGNLGQQMENMITLLKNYWILFQDTVIQLWQYSEFRVLVYVFLGLSFLPLSVFMVFCTCLSSLVFFVAAGVWLFFGGIAFFVLLPFLIGSFGVALALVLAYQVYVYFMTPNTSNDQIKDEN